MVLLLAILFFSAAVSAEAVTYYVATDGDDANTGLAEGTAWASIDNGDQKFILAAGDTVMVLPGTYSVTGTYHLTINGALGNEIVYMADSSGEVVFDAGLNPTTVMLLDGNDVIVSGFTVSNAATIGIRINADRITLRDCTISNITSGPAIEVDGNVNLILRNIIYSVTGNGITNFSTSHTNEYYHNTVYGCTGTGIAVVDGAGAIRLFNNIIAGNLNGVSAPVSTVAGFNDIWNNSSTDYSGGVADSAGGISADPLFTDAAGGDFSLQTGSPAINTGLDLGYAFEESGPDMGAWESPHVTTKYYVSTGGNNDDDGLTEGTAWASIDNGDVKGLLYPGDTVYVLNGTYTTTAAIMLSTYGQANHPVLYLGESQDEVILDIEDNDWAGVTLLGNHSILKNMSVINAGQQGIQVSADSCRISTCFVRDCVQSGIRVFGDYNLLYRNVVDHAGLRGLLCTDGADYNLIHNNTVYSCGDIGIWLTDAVTTARVFNNIVVNCGEGIHAISSNICGFNDVWNNAGGNYVGGVADSAGGISADPKFINPSANEFHLNVQSPARNSGMNLGYPYYESAPDMGAYEYGKPGAVAFIEVEPEDDTKSPGQTIQYAANAYDVDSNFVKSITNESSWFTTDPDGSISASGLYTAGAIGGEYYNRAEFGILKDSGHILITDALSYIRIELADGTPVDDTTLSADNDTTELYCRGYTSGDVLLGIVAADWLFIDDTLGVLNPATGGQSTLELTTIGSARIAVNNGEGQVDTTGTIICVGGLPASIDISPDSAELSTDSALHFTCQSYDADGNPSVPGALPTWEVIGAIGDIDINGDFDPTTVGVGQIAATAAGLNDTVGPITVTAGALYSLVISPDSIDLGVGDSVQFSVDGFDADNNAVASGDITWKALGRVGTIDNSGLFHATAPGRAKVSALSSINDVTDTTGYIDVEELLVSTIPIGTQNANPGETDLSILTITIDNYYDEDKTITDIILHDGSTGAGISEQLLANVDLLKIYLDQDDDSALTAGDSLIASISYDGSANMISFNPLTITARTGITLLTAVDLNGNARDGDSIDVFLIPADDIITGDATIPSGADSANSVGVVTVNGMVAEQITLYAAGADTIMPGAGVYPVLGMDIPRNGYQTDTLHALTVVNYGTADAGDLDQLLLYADDGNGSWDDNNTEILLGELAFIGDRWSLSGFTQPLSGPVTRLYVGTTLSGYPANGATLALSIPQDGLIVWSGNDGPIDSGLSAVDTVVIATSETIQIAAVKLVGQTLIPGELTAPLTGLTIINGRGVSSELDSIRVSLNAVTEIVDQDQYDLQFDSLLLYHDLDGNPSVLGAADTLLASALVSDGVAVFAANGLTIAPTGGEVSLSIAAAINLRNARNGEIVMVSIADAEDWYFADAAVPEGEFPLTSDAEHDIDAFPVAALEAFPTGQATLYGGRINQPVFGFALPRNGYASDILRQIRIVNAGTLDEGQALNAVRLWRDLTGDGFSNDDVAVGAFSEFSDYWQLSDINVALAESLTRFVITVDVVNEYFDGGILQFVIPVGGITCTSGMTGPDDDNLTDPDAHLVFPSNRMTVISIPSASTTVHPGQANNTILTFALYNGYIGQVKTLTAVNLTNRTITQSTPDFADLELGQVSLCFDADKNRIYNNDSLIATGYFSDGGLRLSGLDVAMPPESLSYFFVLVDLPQSLIDADSLAVAIMEAHHFSFDEPVNVNGDLPLTGGGYLVADGSVSAQYREIALPSRTLSPGDTADLFSFCPPVNGDMIDTLHALRITNTEIADTSDIAKLSLWQDADDDAIWQETDLSLGDFVYTDGVWEITDLEIEIDAMPPALFVRGEVAATATAGTAFRGRIPLEGCQFLSGNDGPIDKPVTASALMPISSSLLRISSIPMHTAYSIGQQIDLTVHVTNTWTSALDSVHVCIGDILNDSLITAVNGAHDPQTLNSGESADYVFTYQADAVGEVAWQLCAVAPTLSDSSAIITTESIQIQAPPGDVAISVVNSIPTSVTRGQEHVFPMSVRFAHPDTALATASLKLDSIRIHIEDESAQPLPADQVFSQIVLAAGATLPVVIDDIPGQSAVSLPFNNPILVAPGEEIVLTFLVSIDSMALANNFAMKLAGPDDLVFTDVNTGDAVAIDGSIAFPLKTEVCRIDDPSQLLAVSFEPVLNETVNVGQEYVPALHLALRHPGEFGSSQIQLTGLTIGVVDTLNAPLFASDVCYSMAVIRQQLIINEKIITTGDSDLVTMPLGSPITLNLGETVDIILAVSLNEYPQDDGFGIIIPDSTAITVRDLASGSLLTATTDTTLATATVFPMHSGHTHIKLPAIPPMLCLQSLLPSSIGGGRDSLPLMELSLACGGDETHSAILLRSLRVRVIDSLTRPLDARQLFDRVGYYDNNDSLIYLDQIGEIPGEAWFKPDDHGFLVNPGDTLALTLVADIEADVPYDHFILMVSDIDGVLLYDATDTSSHPGIIIPVECPSDLPFMTETSSIFLPAGRPTVQGENTAARIAYPGQSGVTLAEFNFNYPATGNVGDVAVNAVHGSVLRRTGGEYAATPSADVFSVITLLLDDEIVAVDSILTDDSVQLTLESAYRITGGTEVSLKLRCDINPSAALANYIMYFDDSTFIHMTDYNMATAIYPSLSGGIYPLTSSELSLAPGSLDGSFTNYPNPFNPGRDEGTTISYVLDRDATVDIEIFTITGEAVKAIVMGAVVPAGETQYESWNGTNGLDLKVVPGTYFCRITARYATGGEESFRRKVAVIR